MLKNNIQSDIQSAIDNNDFDALVNLQREEFNRIASENRKDKLLIYLLGVAEESLKEGITRTNSVNALMLALILARRAGKLQEFCGPLAVTARDMTEEIVRHVNIKALDAE